MCVRVLAPSPTPALTQKHVSTSFNSDYSSEQSRITLFFSVNRLLEHTVYNKPVSPAVMELEREYQKFVGHEAEQVHNPRIHVIF
jgi:hypothetical protein